MRHNTQREYYKIKNLRKNHPTPSLSTNANTETNYLGAQDHIINPRGV